MGHQIKREVIISWKSLSQLKCRIDDPATIKELPTQVVEITLFGAKTLLIQLNTDLSLTTQLEEDNVDTQMR